MQERIAIAIMSFDRPFYLERLLQTVRCQQPFRNLKADFFLFQDGNTSALTGAVFAEQEALKQSQRCFEDYLPDGRILASPDNLGVALNFDRAERSIYEELDYLAAIFLEDDLLLQPQYFRIMEELLELAEGRSDIGMVSARGYRNATPLAEQRRRATEIRLMDEHNWGFGMHREAWRARAEVLQPYLDLLSEVDYRERDLGESKQRLHALQKSFSRHGRGYLTSQDSMKNMAFELLGRHRITTFTNNARYIGKFGLHSNAEKFAARGHHDVVLYDSVTEGFEIPPPTELRRMRLELQYR